MRFGVLAMAAVSYAIGNGVGFAQEMQQLPPLTVTAPPPMKSKANKKKTPATPAKSPDRAALQPGAAASSPTAVDALDPRRGDIGFAQSGSEGYVSRQELLQRPEYRVGEMLEAVPGLVVTQHSGEGKANQYFLRGFNLDHGTDLAITMDGMPVNMRTHGHGQGYADANFIIPELMRGLSFRKGPYFASEGDFSSAGAIYLDLEDKLEKNFAQIELGSFGHRRAVTGMSVPVGLDGTLLVAGEVVRFDGPWDRPDDLRKLNGVMRYSNGSYDNGFALTAMAYSGQWYATDQIPHRAVDEGLVGRFGNIDPTDGGISQRYSLSARWNETTASTATRASAYLVKSDLQLFNNFTFFLNDAVDGDQFQQTDDRTIAGGSVSKTYLASFGGKKVATTIGVQGRYDDIGVGLFNTKERAYLSTVREDKVREASVGIYGESTVRWTDFVRTTLGLRADFYSASVDSDRPVNSGDDIDAILSPKFGVTFGPWESTELYLNAGRGFHSNDARGVMTTIDPVSNTAVDPAPFLVRSEGAEVGLRSQPSRNLTSSLSVFLLDFDSEVVFVGDAGTTEAGRPSRRVGAEYTLQARLTPWMTLDLDAAYTRARFTEDDLEAPGRRIPGAIEGVVGAGLSFDNFAGGWFGAVNVRYFGPRPLIEDDSVRSKSSAPVSGRIGYRFGDGFTARLDGYNLFNQQSSQIDYYYASRLPGEAAEGVDDIHFHPLEPRSFRVLLTKQW